MAVVNLTNAERETLRTEPTFRQQVQQAVITKSAYFMGQTSAATVQDMKNRKLSADIEHNPNTLFDDDSVSARFLFNMGTRDFWKKDDAAGGTLVDQVMAYLNDSSRIDFLVDDYFLDKTANMIH